MDRDQLIEELKKIPSNYEVEVGYSRVLGNDIRPSFLSGPIQTVKRSDMGLKILIIFDSPET